MLLWTRHVLGSQIALHNGNSTSRDTDQLVWSLACVLKGSREWTWVLGEQDLIRQALAAIFATQTKFGNWPTFRPLFHYRKSGNAYCYIFETLGALLRAALRRDAGFLRAQLRPYCDNLALLWKYADATAIPLGSSGQRGWSSGHRSQSEAPESWATASVYSFAQLLRRLVGIWTRETALQELPNVSVADTREKSESQLRARGNTWSTKPVSDDLLCLFVNPARLSEAKAVSLDPESLDPDKISIQAEYSRSAILCGPPGTSKTTLARSIAGALAWNYVEIHASNFVSEGLPNVQKRADEIFSRLMELDRTVVLFDEIDELVRQREKDKADVFGRFLTTSMLPKIAELWNAQKVLYFVATNHVKMVDPAILRSQRFDAIIFVPPPSFEVKVARLNQVLGEWSTRAIEVQVRAEDCESALSRVPPEKEKPLPADCMLAKFILLRWDQLEELSHRLRRAGGGNDLKLAITADSLSSALAEIADVRLAAADTYTDYGEERGFARRDFGKHKVWVIEGSFEEPPTKRCVWAGDSWWLSGAIESVRELAEEFEKMGWRVEEAQPGTVRISKMETPEGLG
jgi:ATPase family protein associated with various cellular activities (AAA)